MDSFISRMCVGRTCSHRILLMYILITFFVILNFMGMWLDTYGLDGLDLNVAGYVCSTK